MNQSFQRRISNWDYRVRNFLDKCPHPPILRLILFFIIFFLFYRLFQNALIDDAFITLDYVKTIIRSGEWGFFPGRVTNTATSPLNVIFLSVFGLILGCRTTLPILVASFCSTVSLHFLEKISFKLFSERKFGTVGALALVLNPLLISTLGMESLLFGMLIIISLYSYLESKWPHLGISLGLLTLTRPDGLIYALVFVCLVPFRNNRFKTILLYFFTTLPWYLFSWIRLGSIIPDTLIIKTVQPKWGPYVFSNGLQLYSKVFPFEIFLSFIFLPFIFTLANRQIRQNKITKILLYSGILQLIGYSLLNVAPYHWYYAPVIINLTIFSCLSLGFLSSRIMGTTVRRVALILFLLIPSLGLGRWLFGTHFTINEMPIHTNWATKAQYQEIGLWLKKECGSDSIRLEGEIGTIAYYSDCYVLDSFSDRTWLPNMVEKLKNGNGLLSSFIRANYLFLPKEPAFPLPKYKLIVYHGDNDVPRTLYKKWITSTRWTPSSLIAVQQQ
jgi:hypothetical protein